MSKEDKYYTPDPEEFHVGFECEVVQEAQWVVVEAIDTTVLPYFERRLNEDSCRVKLLDREDIENLGFEHDFNLDGEAYPDLFEEHGYSQGFALDTQLEDDKLILFYLYPDGYVIIDYVYKCGSYPHAFMGILKNKSELKRLLKQIGV
jgi:hypothetical protein